MRELLLLLCRYPYDPSNRDTLSKLLREVDDWHSMVNLINAHGIIALAAYNIKEARLENEIPLDAMAFLENGYMQSVVRNSWLTERWKEVNQILNDAGIKHILLKGMALEHTIYGSKGLRQMNDNDILIKPGESRKAWYLLEQNGFTMKPLKSPLFKKIMFDFGHHLPALYKNGYAIEIHEKLFEDGGADDKSYPDPFKDAVEIFIGETKAFMLSEHIHVKYLTKHFEHHKMAGDCQLRLFNDLIMLNQECNLKFPDSFISDPIQENKLEFRKALYKTTVSSVSSKYRLRFILGDIFPSFKWMKDRYKCNFFNALLRYPFRIGKFMWLVDSKTVGNVG